MRLVKVSRKKPGHGSIIFAVAAFFQFQGVQAENFGLSSSFGHNSNFWNNVDTLKSSNELVDDLEQIFDSNYRDPSEGVFNFSLNYQSIPPDFVQRTFDRGSVTVSFDQIAGGEIYNRISPEVRGYSVWTTSFKASLIAAPDEDKSGPEFSIGNEVGFGRQRLIDGSVADFLLGDPEIKSSIFYFGLDAGIAWKNMVSPHLRFRNRWTASPTYFYSAFKDPAYEFRVDSGKLYFRWKTETEIAALWSGWAGGEVGVQALAGQQPVPVDLTPRIWDAVHRIEAFPSFGSAVGLGSFFRVHSRDRKFRLEGMAGFYGGYVGGALSLNLYFLKLEAGTFGLEQTAGFQVRESRVNYVSGGIHHVW
jgi:hypothetical protein